MNSQILSVVPSVSFWNMTSVLKGMVLRHIPQILLDIPVEEQIHIVNGRIVHQPFQFTALVYIPCNLGFYQGAVNGNHASVSEFDLHTGGVDIEHTGNHILIHNSVLLKLFLFSWSSGF